MPGLRHRCAETLTDVSARDTSMDLHIQIGPQRFRADVARAHDISIPLEFDALQPNFFGAPRATAKALSAGSFIGDVRRGGSCNCATYTITPHCNGTHTECVGHLTDAQVGIRNIGVPPYLLARLITVQPVSASMTNEASDPAPRAGDFLITRSSLDAALHGELLKDARALIVRTSPNDLAKRHRQYGPEVPPPYFTAEFMRTIVAAGIEHLIVDLPSIDRAEDEGRLTAHRIFFGLPAGSTNASVATRAHATVTELAFIDDAVADGSYVLNLQIAPFASDAAPSRPLLLPLTPA